MDEYRKCEWCGSDLALDGDNNKWICLNSECRNYFLKVEYRVEKVSEREKAILFDYDGIAEDNEVTKIIKKEGI